MMDLHMLALQLSLRTCIRTKRCNIVSNADNRNSALLLPKATQLAPREGGMGSR